MGYREKQDVNGPLPFHGIPTDTADETKNDNKNEK